MTAVHDQTVCCGHRCACQEPRQEDSCRNSQIDMLISCSMQAGADLASIFNSLPVAILFVADRSIMLPVAT